MVRPARFARQHAQRRVLAVVAASTLSVLLTAAASPGPAAASGLAGADSSSDGERVLQSVSVTMAPDGTFTEVEGTTVSTSDGSDESSSSSKTYSPQDVVGDLPVRVLTAYRTEQGAGSDLAELDGYTGRVEIDLTVQNLTMRPQTLEYDVDGSSRSRAALVGAPLTVVASTVLDGTDPSAVVTPTSGKTTTATNGVLSQAADGTTQVQWATILAPPQLEPSATLTLVVDAKDFSAPAFDLSVQPGLVTDPSVGALVDAAFQPADSSELRLQSRTIELVGEVNTVLARAGQTISQVRTTLDSSAETLGTKTVSDLEASAVGVASSMKSLDGAVQSLGQDLSSSLESTRSSALEQLRQTVDALDRMLGDTSIKPQTAAVRGQGCATSVAAPQAASSVYGNVVQVASQLGGYARATDSCKVSLQQSILDSVGPAEPSEERCTTASVTCALFGARTSFGKIADRLVKDGDSALSALEPERLDDAVTATAELSADVDAVSDATSALMGSAPLGRVNLKLKGVTLALGDVRDAAQGVRAVVGEIHDTAVDAQAEVGSMTAQNAALAAELCGLVGDDTEPGTLSAEKVEELRSYLVAESCDGSDTTGQLSASGGQSASMEARLTGQADAWSEVVRATTTSDATQGSGQALAALDAAIGAVAEQLDLIRGSVERDSGDVEKQVRDLDGTIKNLQKARTDVSARIAKVRDQQDAVVAAVQEAFRSAADDASVEVAGTVDPEIRRVSTRSAESREELGRMFDQSASGLSTAAASIVKDGAKTLERQKKTFAQSQEAAGVRISGQVEEGLSMIARGVSSSTRDMEAAGALLTQDLNRVLLDLGDRRVNGSGLLGAMTTGAATARSADYQLALATDKTTSYANVRSADIGGLLLRQAQSDAALRMQAELPAFALELPAGTEHRTVYTFHIGAAS
jgi:hypothetical protein